MAPESDLGAHRFPRLRLAAFYAAYFGAMGGMLPFWPAWLEARGASDAEIGILLAVGVWVRAIAAPVAAARADRSGRRRGPMVGLSIATAVAFAAFALAHEFWALLVVSLLFGALWAPVLAIGESLCNLVAVEQRLSYGRIRLWGSLSFIAVVVLAGWMVRDIGAASVYWLILGLLVGQIIVCRSQLDVRAPERHTGSRAPTAQLLRQPLFVWFVLAAALNQASHGAYYAFSTLQWQSQGIDDRVIGALWGAGVIAEIVLFAFAPQLTRRFGAAGLLLLGSAAGVVRWLVTGVTDDVAVLAFVQLLHACTFGATHLGAMAFITRFVQPSLSASAQSLYMALAHGAVMGLAVAAAGGLQSFGPAVTFGVMAGISLTGGACGLVVLNRVRGNR